MLGPGPPGPPKVGEPPGAGGAPGAPGPPGGGAWARAWAARERAWVISRKARRSSKRALSRRFCSGGGEVAGCFFREDGEHVNGLAGAEDVDLGLLALLGAAAELQDGLHVDGLDELVEAHGGGVIHAWVGGTDGDVEAVSGGGVGEAGLLHLLRRGGRGEVGVFFVRSLRLRCRGDEVGGVCDGGGGDGSTDSGRMCFSEGGASGRGSPSALNLRRSLTTKGRGFSDMGIGSIPMGSLCRMRIAGLGMRPRRGG